MNLSYTTIKSFISFLILIITYHCNAQHQRTLAHSPIAKTIEAGLFTGHQKAGVCFSHTHPIKNNAMIEFLISYGENTDREYLKDELLTQCSYGKNIYQLNHSFYANCYIGGFISSQRSLGLAIGPVTSLEFEYFFTKKLAFKTSGALLYYSPVPENEDLQWRAYAGIKYILTRRNKRRKQTRNKNNKWCD